MMSCNFCHGWKELEFHPLLYKTLLSKRKRVNMRIGNTK